MCQPDDGAARLRELLVTLKNTRMPFGRFGPGPKYPQGLLLVQLPLEYLAWFKLNGFPKGRIGYLLEQLYELRANGMEHLLYK